MSSERLILALVIAAVPTAVVVLLAPSDIYARIVVGVGALIASFPAAYLLAGVRA